MADLQAGGEGTGPGLLDLEKELICSVCLERGFEAPFPLFPHIISNPFRYVQIYYTNL